jgi:hypothetical protein
MAILIDGSKMRTDAFYGQNGSAQPSSLQPGDTIKRSAVAKSIIAADGSVSANPPNNQTRPVSPDQKVKTTPGMKNPNVSPAKVPGKVNRAR